MVVTVHKKSLRTHAASIPNLAFFHFIVICNSWDDFQCDGAL